MKMKQTGSVWDNHGLWYYSVKLPGEKTRRNVPLKASNSNHTMRTDRPRKMAAAARHAARVTPVYGKRKSATTCAARCAR